MASKKEIAEYRLWAKLNGFSITGQRCLNCEHLTIEKGENVYFACCYGESKQKDRCREKGGLHPLNLWQKEEIK